MKLEKVLNGTYLKMYKMWIRNNVFNRQDMDAELFWKIFGTRNFVEIMRNEDAERRI